MAHSLRANEAKPKTVTAHSRPLQGGRVLVLTIAVLTLSLCSVAGQPLGIGTEDDPEISDPEGDVSYHTTNVANRDYKFLDALAAWIQYDGAMDFLRFTIKVADLSEFQERTRDLNFVCNWYMRGAIGNQTQGTLGMHLQKPPGSTGIAHNLTYTKPGGGAIDLAASLEPTFGAPGYWSVATKLAPLQNILESIEGPTNLFCVAGQQAAGYTLINSDEAEGNTAFDISALTADQSSGPEPNAPVSTLPSSTDEEPNRTSGAPLWSVSIALAAAVLARRYRS